MMQRRRLLLAGLATGLASSTLVGCGFELRHRYNMAFKSIQLTGFAGNSPLAAELARALEASGVDVVGSTLEAVKAASSATVPRTHIVFNALKDSRDMVVSSTTAYSQVRSMSVRSTVTFQILRGDGTVLLSNTEVALARDMSYNEKDALAKQNESAAMYRAMQTDIVNQLMRRLSAIQPEQLVAPAAAASGPVSASSQPQR
jgi:LPS-assembly lipoprotein